VQQQFVEIINNIEKFLPEITIIITILVCLVLDLIIKKKSPIVSLVGIIGLIVSAYFVYKYSNNYEILFTRMIVIDPYAVFFKFLFILSSILVILFFNLSEEISTATHKNEFILLILSLALGAFLMASSVNLLMMYLSLELASITSYILAGYTKKLNRSSEAAMKYLIYGAASSGIMLFGMTLLYGFTGSMNIYDISRYLAIAKFSNPFIILVMIMISAGFGYKISSVPFHFWTPDVYEGSPTPVSAFLAVTSSAAGFAVMVRFFITTFISDNTTIDGYYKIIQNVNWQEIIIFLSVASMFIGNFIAIWQKSMRRLLGYSSIAQAGYILTGLVIANQLGITALLIYLAAYLFMNLGAFFATIMIVNKIGTDNIEDMKGLAYRSPVVCSAMALFMLALAGIPGTVGFIGKFYLVAALLKPGTQYLWLAIVLMLNSVISLFFYFKVVKKMFLEKSDEEQVEVKYSFSYYLVLIILAIPTIFFGLYFTPIVKLAENSAKFFGIN